MMVSTDNEESLPEETLPSCCNVNVLGWESDNNEEATAFAYAVLAWIKQLSRYLDLSRLASVKIAVNYREALENVDRGADLPSAMPTSNEYGHGGAMSLRVIKDDELWSEVVIWTNLVRQLTNPDHPEYGLARMTLIHELVHVDDLRLLTRTYPGGWRNANPSDARKRSLLPIVEPCASEYSAQRRSAFAAPEHGLDLLDMLEKALTDVGEQVRTARLSYRIDGDLDKYWSIVVERLRFLFQAIGYGIGHYDGIDAIAIEHPKLMERYKLRFQQIAELPSGWLLQACREAVVQSFTMEKWMDLSIYDPLIDVLEKLLNENGMITSNQNGELYVDMPYTGFHDL